VSGRPVPDGLDPERGGLLGALRRFTRRVRRGVAVLFGSGPGSTPSGSRGRRMPRRVADPRVADPRLAGADPQLAAYVAARDPEWFAIEVGDHPTLLPGESAARAEDAEAAKTTPGGAPAGRGVQVDAAAAPPAGDAAPGAAAGGLASEDASPSADRPAVESPRLGFSRGTPSGAPRVESPTVRPLVRPSAVAYPAPYAPRVALTRSPTTQPASDRATQVPAEADARGVPPDVGARVEATAPVPAPERGPVARPTPDLQPWPELERPVHGRAAPNAQGPLAALAVRAPMWPGSPLTRPPSAPADRVVADASTPHRSEPRGAAPQPWPDLPDPGVRDAVAPVESDRPGAVAWAATRATDVLVDEQRST
jgi:hypothetical protein